MTSYPHTPNDAWNDDDFVEDRPSHVVVVAPHVTRSRDDELRAWMASRERDSERRMRDGIAPLFPRVSFVEWSRTMQRSWERPTSLTTYRTSRSHDAIVAMLRRCVNDAHTRTRAHDDDVPMLLDDGTVVHTDTRRAAQSHDAMLASIVAARRIARRYRRTQLHRRYWGTLTRDGMALNGTTTANRLTPLDDAIALSDTVVTLNGAWHDTRYARGVVRHDDHTVDSESTVSLRRFKRRHTKGTK